MAVKLRKYQEELITGIFNAWQEGHKNVLGVSITGSGKTVVLSEVVRRLQQPTCVMAHRGEIVAQLSETLALVGITHRIIASGSTRAMCIARHVRRFGRSYVHDQSPVGVASVQTIVKRAGALKQWLPTVKLVVGDEFHHYIRDNQFGTALAMFPNAKVLGVTATPDRCDRKSLARVQTGVIDHMVEGPTARWLIDEGYLSPYKYYAPPPSIKMDEDDVSPSTGEYKADAVRKKSHESRIVGDVVATYQKFASGKQAIVFTVDVETSQEMSRAFNEAGIPSAAISGKTPAAVRNALMDKFTSGSIKVIQNTDLFGEGLDLPGVDCVILARPTQSTGLYLQQCGRGLRPVYADGYDLNTREGRIAAIAAGPKPHAILIDHVSNFLIHRLPDADRHWQLVRPDSVRGKKNRDDELPLTSCTRCYTPRLATIKICPSCGHKEEPLSRASIEHVEGDLEELSPEVLAKLRGDVKRVDGEPLIPHGASPAVIGAVTKRWKERQDAQSRLRHSIAIWAAYGRDGGKSDSELHREFFFRSGGVDVLKAQTLGATDAEALREKVENWHLTCPGTCDMSQE